MFFNASFSTRPLAAFALLLFIGLSQPAQAIDVALRMPEYENIQHAYFFELLIKALEADGHTVTMKSFSGLPHMRERVMFSKGEINVLWLLKTEERDKQYLSTEVPLTNGLIGHRIMLVPPMQTHMYKYVKNIEDFRRLALTAGLGTGWFDTSVWKHNDLAAIELANWRLIYRMLEQEDRGVDYFPRGFTEILQEATDNPNLAIEPNILFVYDRDFIFYVSPTEPKLLPVIKAAMLKAKKSGLIGQLIKKHWSKSFEVIKPESRTVIKLKTP